MTVTYFKRYRMHVDLRIELFEQPELPQGYRILEWSKEILTKHADAKFQSFKNELDANVFPCLGDSYGCHRLMRDISCRQGFVPEATWLIVRDDAQPPRPISCGTIQGIREQGRSRRHPKHWNCSRVSRPGTRQRLGVSLADWFSIRRVEIRDPWKSRLTILERFSSTSGWDSKEPKSSTSQST